MFESPYNHFGRSGEPWLILDRESFRIRNLSKINHFTLRNVSISCFGGFPQLSQSHCHCPSLLETSNSEEDKSAVLEMGLYLQKCFCSPELDRICIQGRLE